MTNKSSPGKSAIIQVAPVKTSGLVYLAAVFAAVGGLLSGYDTGIISGALPFIRHSFTLSTFQQGFVVSVVLVGAAIAAMTGGRFSDRFGRRNSLILTAAIFIAGALISAVAGSMQMLIAGRLVIGFGIGLASSVVPLYISEIAPANARGLLVSLYQLAVTLGILAAYLVAYVFAATGNWRWMLGLAVVPGAMLAAGMLYLPETPRYLARHGRLDEARQVLARVRQTQDVDDELQQIEAALATQEERGRFSDLFIPAVRPALVVGIGLAVFQQVTGINTVIYFAPTIIKAAGVSSIQTSILATAGIGTVNVIMTIVSMWLIDRVGRRPLLLTGIAGMTISLGVLGYVFHLSENRGGGLANVAVITLMVYVASFAISLGPIFWLLISEIYPAKIRGLAAGIASGANWTSNFVVSLTFLTLVEHLGSNWTFWLYGLLSLAAWFFSYYLVPETKGHTLEEIQNFWRQNR